ncbi:MAG TPA: hypothetical protein VJI73_01630 [Candidatus Paceibacterota bacterium]
MKETRTQKIWEHFWGDAALVTVSFIFTLYWLKSGTVERLIDRAGEFEVLGSLIAGMLFTSVFTTAPAIIFLGKLGQVEPFWLVSLVGAFGAMLGDVLIFRFLKDSLVKDVETLISLARPKRLKGIFHLKFFRWFTTFLGALVIASPLPDELGITMMGLAKTNNKVFMPISFAMNFLGIVMIVLFARAL